MSLFDGLGGLGSETADALSDLGAPDQADDLNQATQWIQDAINAAGTLPVPRARFLIGDRPQPNTTPVDRVDWSDALIQAGNLGGALLDEVLPGAGGFAELGTAIAEQEIFGKDARDDYEHPVHLVRTLDVREGLDTLWSAKVTLLKPDLAGFLPPGVPLDVLQVVEDAFSDQHGDGWLAPGSGRLPGLDPKDRADINNLISLGQQAANNPSNVAAQVWATENPDQLDRKRITRDHAQEPTQPYVGRTQPQHYIGKFARLCVARRFDDSEFTLNERWFSGTVTAFEDLGMGSTPGGGLPTAAKWREVRVTLRPRLFQLSLRRRHRIFKDLNAIEIVLEILDEHEIYPAEPGEGALTARRLEPGGREFFGPIAVPDALTSMVDNIAGAVPGGYGEGVGDAINSVLEQDIAGWRPKRDMCVQYGETDLAFVRRLLAEEGLSFFFESRETRETLVICEDPRLAGKKTLTASRLPIPVVPARNNGSIVEQAWNVGVARLPVPSGVTVRDRSFARPYEATDLAAGESLDLLSPGGLSSLGTLGGLEQMANQVVGLATEAAGTPGTEDYAGPEALFFEWPAGLSFPATGADEAHSFDAFDGPPMGQLRLEHFRSRGAITRGSSDCATLTPGHHVNLLHGAFDVLHPAVQKPQRFLITGVRHRASVAPSATAAAPYEIAYRNDFQAQNALLPIRPEKPDRPKISGVQTAIIIDTEHGEDPGRSGQEVSVLPEQHAWRVRVRFPWEREPDVGSAWMRFAQPFAGASFGTLLTPRVGMEVVIGFDEGNPDRPYVLGTLYSDTHDRAVGARHTSSVQPKDATSGRIDHPARLTDSGFRSRSWKQSERGEGARGNRLRFDDFATNERIEVFARHDYAKEAGGSRDEEPYGDHVTTVKGQQTIDVGTDQRETVAGDQTLLARHVSADEADWGRKATVGGDETIQIGEGSVDDDASDSPDTPAAMKDRIEGSETLTVGGWRDWFVDGSERIHIEGGGAINAGEEVERPGRSLDVSGNSTVTVEGDDTFVVSGDRRVQVEGAYTLKAEKLDMKVVPPGGLDEASEGDEGETPGSDEGEAEALGGIEVDEEGARLGTKGSVDIETETFTAESTGGRMLVKAATRIKILVNGNKILLDGDANTITMDVATARRFRLGTEAAYIEGGQTHLLLSAGGSSWETTAAADGMLSKLDGPTVTIAASDEIALEAPSIHLGEMPEDT